MLLCLPFGCEGARVTVAPWQFVFVFDMPHKIGSVCLPPCPQCGETPGNLGDISDMDANITQEIPALAILREATREEYFAFCAERGSGRGRPKPEGFYYVVTMD